MLDDIEPNYNHVYNPPMPPDTPLALPYPNLKAGTQHARNNFGPRKCKRKLGRVVSNQEDAASLTRMLQKYWGHGGWRGPQLDICKAAMEGQDILLVAPTGLGKSVCFQVPAITMEYGVTLVISPLLALMKDQVSGLQKKGINAAMLYEKSSFQEMAYIKKQLKMGHPEMRLLYITPETLFSAKIEFELTIAYDQKQINRLIIDEAHVIEEWGLTFRSAYRDLGNFRLRFPSVPITAVTASATEDVRADILATLGVKKDRLFQRVEPFNRKNLFYEVRYQGDVSNEVKQENLANFIKGYRPDAMKRNKKHRIKGDTVSGLVYCRYRALCDDVAWSLNKHGVKSLAFHAKLSDAARQSVLEKWQAGEVECIVATIAFGMGVDQAHVRYVVHYDIPRTFEGYYQETGRAGRDGHLSRCILYYSREDAQTLRRLIETEANKMAEKRLKTPGDEETSKADAEKAKIRGLNSFKSLQFYAENLRLCRHVAICRYFGEQIDAMDEKIMEAYCNKTCDICSNPAAVRRRAMMLTEEMDISSQLVHINRPPAVPSHASDTSRTVASITEVPEASPINQDSQSEAPCDSMASLRLLHHDKIPISSNGEALPSSPAAAPPIKTARVHMLEGGNDTQDQEDDFDMPSSPSPKSRSFVKVPTKGQPVEDGFSVEEFLQEQEEDIFRLRPPSAHAISEDVHASLSEVEDSFTGSLEEDSNDKAEHMDGNTSKEPIVPRTFTRQKAYAPVQVAGEIHATTNPPRPPPYNPQNECDPYETLHRGVQCETPQRSGPSRTKERKYVRTGHPSLLNMPISAQKGATLSDLFDGGSYAVADGPPADEEKRQRQQEAFKAVTPITGRGPFSYYTNTAAPVVGRKRKASTASEAGLGFRTPFKPPVTRPREKERVGVISKENRMAAIATLKDALKKSLVDGPEANRLWRYWGEPNNSRKVASRLAAVELESVIIRGCATPNMLSEKAAEVAASIRILRSKEGAKIVTGGKLREYEDDAHGRWLILVDEVIRAL